MSWHSLDPTTRELAERLCTEKELQALKLWENGCGYRRTAHILGISMSSARDRIHRSLDKISRNQEANGHQTHTLRKPHRPPTQGQT